MNQKIASWNFDLGEHGAQHLSAVVSGRLNCLRSALSDLRSDRPGIRLSGIPELQSILKPDGLIGALAAEALGPTSKAVRAIFFDKSATINWSLRWHQDRTICVRERRDVDGFGPWTLKAGMLHVSPPFELLARMVTIRVHLDDVPSDNAPLLIAPGSHRDGRIPVERIHEVVRKRGEYACLAEAGDVWLYSTPILHASKAASKPDHRRVLQIDFSPDALPGGLEWLGI